MFKPIFFISQIIFKIRISYKILRGQRNTYEKVFTKVEESVYKVPFLCRNIELDVDDNDNDRTYTSLFKSIFGQLMMMIIMRVF